MYLGYTGVWGIQGVYRCIGAYRYMGVYKCIGHTDIWGVYLGNTDVWGHTGDVQMYKGHTDVLGYIDKWGSLQMYRAYIHMGESTWGIEGVYRCMGHTDIWRMY